MSIVIAVILLILVFENTMIMFMMATITSNTKKETLEEISFKEISDAEKKEIIETYLRETERDKFKRFAEYMINDYDKYEANENIVRNSHSDK